MQMASEHWPALSRLFDAALELEPAARQRWLAALPAEFAPLGDALRALLASHAQVATGDFLEALPRLDLNLEALDGQPAAAAGTVIGPYVLEDELGRGGMGIVWRAVRFDGQLKRPVALKLPHPSLARSLVDRFLRERDILAALNHPNIARLYDAGVSAGGQPYLALEVVEGQPIDTYCDVHGLDLRRRIQLLERALAAIQFAHGRLVVHRDIKPSNILVTAEGEVKLLDFGIAKLLGEGNSPQTELTQLGGQALTPAYASPEQILGQTIGTASDVYSLGVLLYELLVGSPPYSPTRNTRASLEDAILSTEPIKPSKADIDERKAKARGSTPKKLARLLAGDLDIIMLKALKKTVSDRYASVQALRDDLMRYLAGEPVLARADSTWYRTCKFIGRHRLETAAAAAAILALAVFTASLDIQLGKVTRERDRADRLAQFMVHVFEVANPSQAGVGSITARDLLDKASQDIESGLTADPGQRAQLLATMARSYTNLGAFDRSEALLRREIERATAALGPNDRQVMALQVELIWKDYTARQYQAGLSLGRRLLDRQRRVLGPDDPLTARTELHLMLVLNGLGQVAEAARMGRHAVLIEGRTAKPDDLDLFRDEADVAFFEFRAGQGTAQEVERRLRLLVDRNRAALGPANARTLSSIDRLGVLLAHENRVEEEVVLLRAAVAEGKRALGSEPSIIGDILDNLAAALLRTGDLPGAEKILHESLDLNRRLRGENSPRVAQAEYNLACLFARRGENDAAIAMLETSVGHGLSPDATLQMESDTDLIGLKDEPRFKTLIAKVTKAE